MKITFMGNCQTLALCYYFQQLQYSNASWICYGEEMKRVIIPRKWRGLFIKPNHWSDKCKNKIFNYLDQIEEIQKSDVIIYQEISTTKSYICNTKLIKELCKTSCRLIKLPCIYLEYHDYDNSIKELQARELANSVDICVSKIFEKFRDQNMLLTKNHPNTFLFMQIVEELCSQLNIPFFSEERLRVFLQNNNYIDLPFVL